MRGFAIVFAGEGADAHVRTGRWRGERPVVCGRARMCSLQLARSTCGSYDGAATDPSGSPARGVVHGKYRSRRAGYGRDVDVVWTENGGRSWRKAKRERNKERKKERLRVPVRRRPGRVISSVSVCSIATRGWLARQRARFAADGLSDGNLAKADLYPRILAAAVGAGGISGATRAREGWRGCGMQLAVFGQRSQSRVGCGRAGLCVYCIVRRSYGEIESLRWRRASPVTVDGIRGSEGHRHR